MTAIFSLALCRDSLARSVVFAIGSNKSMNSHLKDLRYATSDARKFANIMETVGMLSRDSISLIENPKLSTLRQAMKEAKKLWSADHHEAVQKFVFYFSGHADTRGLHLSDGIYSKDDLHADLEGIKAKTKVVILDSCFAGGIAEKGIREAKPFKIPRFNYDEPSGSIFLSATSADRLAYESKELGGSLFSYNIIRGLEGKADGNQDGVVTATELYEYSFQQSQLQSQIIPAFSQKPEFISDLKGRGAVALAFPRSQTGILRLAGDFSGLLQINSLRGLNSLQVDTAMGMETKINLPAGEYQIRLAQADHTGITQAAIYTNKSTLLTQYDFNWQDDQKEELASRVHEKGLQKSSINYVSKPSTMGLGFSFIKQEKTSVQAPTLDLNIGLLSEAYQDLLFGYLSYGLSSEIELLSMGLKLNVPLKFVLKSSRQGFMGGLDLGLTKIDIQESEHPPFDRRQGHPGSVQAISLGAQLNYYYLLNQSWSAQMTAREMLMYETHRVTSLRNFSFGAAYHF